MWRLHIPSMCSELACRTITMRQWTSVGCLDSWMRHILTMRPTTNTHQLRTNTALWASSWHFSHKLYNTAHKTPRTPLGSLCSNYQHIPLCCPLLHSTVTTIQTALLHWNPRQRCTTSAHAHSLRPVQPALLSSPKEKRWGEGNSLSFYCVLATLKPNTLSCNPNLPVHTANYYFPYLFLSKYLLRTIKKNPRNVTKGRNATSGAAHKPAKLIIYIYIITILHSVSSLSSVYCVNYSIGEGPRIYIILWSHIAVMVRNVTSSVVDWKRGLGMMKSETKHILKFHPITCHEGPDGE